MYNNNWNYNQGRPIYYARETNLLYRVYAWMCLALSITALTAYAVSLSPSFINFLAQHSSVLWILAFAQIGLVVILTSLLQRINVTTAAALFVLYAFSLGISLSPLFIIYTQTSLAATFAVTAGMFGAMALYGYYTKSDLSAIGSFAFMALIGLMLGALVNLFLKSEGFSYVLSVIGVIVFTLLTAYDIQRIKVMTEEMQADGQTMAKVSIVGALVLYLDFVNLFLYLIQILGRRRD